MYKKKKTGIIGVIITIIILIIIVIFSNTQNSSLSYTETIFNKIVMPIQNGLTHLKNKISGNGDFFADIEKLKSENQYLKDQNSELEQELRELEIIKSENNTLKEYLNLSEKYKEYTTVPAQIINKNISNYTKTIVVNVGSDDGIQPDMVVIADKGLVGYVVSTTDSTAKVQTIIDPATTVSAVISTSRDGIICRGMLEEGQTIKATYIPTNVSIVEGDDVETSGIGGIYPKGIHIGTIKRVINTKNITDRYLLIEPTVNFSKLETVLIIK